jgi:hypothetical protein
VADADEQALGGVEEGFFGLMPLYRGRRHRAP